MPRADMSRFIGKDVTAVSSEPRSHPSQQPAPEVQPGMAVQADQLAKKARVTFDVDEDQHRAYKSWCSLHGTTMRNHLSAYIEQTLKSN